jgi:hypothetical protein
MLLQPKKLANSISRSCNVEFRVCPGKKKKIKTYGRRRNILRTCRLCRNKAHWHRITTGQSWRHFVLVVGRDLELSNERKKMHDTSSTEAGRRLKNGKSSNVRPILFFPVRKYRGENCATPSPPPLCHLQEKEGGVDERATSRSVGLPSSFSLCPTFSLFLSLQLVESWLNWINVPKRNKKKKKRWSARESVAMASLCTHTHVHLVPGSFPSITWTRQDTKNIHRLAVHSFSYRPMWRKSLSTDKNNKILFGKERK